MTPKRKISYRKTAVASAKSTSILVRQTSNGTTFDANADASTVKSLAPLATNWTKLLAAASAVRKNAGLVKCEIPKTVAATVPSHFDLAPVEHNEIHVTVGASLALFAG